ncbi:MAG: NADH-quinone oxidoreductase subunit L [Deltaproteobacteria bacterium]|nr:NADH-quinone oxidoreductase subunit L [Deltaproteobacteria bacterium]
MRSNALLFAIPLLPLAGAVWNAVFGRRLARETVAFVGCGVVGIAFALALVAFVGVAGGRGDVVHVAPGFSWIVAGNFAIEVRLLFDNLSSVMTLVVTGVSFLIHVYSVGYMAHDAGFARYFTYLNLFVFAMLMLVLGDSLPVMFVGWEGVGLCSYLLIGFWFEDDAKASAGKKAFITNRVGDAGFLLAIFYIGWVFAQAAPDRSFSLSYGELKANAAALAPHATVIALLLFVGAIGKSAQLPLYFWLPDAMAGPTPVSALIHAATMVTAGVYMVARLGFLYALSPVASSVVAGVGAVTAFFAATIAVTQTDIKKVLAFSTVSQLGFMFLGVGVMAYSAGIFHLMTHAFFKACLFLGAGSVIHAMSGEQDIRKMGGLWSKVPRTAKTFFVATLAIAGLPFLSGWVSKDEILDAAFHSTLPGAKIFFGVALATAGLTAFYMFRLFFIVFTGKPSHEAEHAHESPPSMTVPLIVLAALSVVGGGFFPGLLPIGKFLGEAHPPSFSESLPPMLMALGVGAAGFFVAYKLYWGGPSPTALRLATAWEKVATASREQWYVDHALGRFVPRVVMVTGFMLWRLVDFFLIDVVILGGASAFAHGIGHLARLAQNGQVQRYATTFIIGIAVLLLFFLRCRS